MRYAHAACIRYAHAAQRAFARPPRMAVLSLAQISRRDAPPRREPEDAPKAMGNLHPGTWKRGDDRTERLDLCAPGLTAPVAYVPGSACRLST